MKYPMIAAAVVAALGGVSSDAYALDVTGTINARSQVVAAGASAARDSFATLLTNTVCEAGSLTIYRAFPTALTDFRAYSCTITAGGTVATVFGTAAQGADRSLTVYYRSEGGSAWGPVSIATNRAIHSLVVDTRCVAAGSLTIGAVSVPLQNCSVTAYSLATDTVTTGLTKRSTQLGVSDEEPDMYVDTNYPGISSNAFPAFSPAVQSSLVQLNRTAAFAQVFGVLLSDSGPTAGITSLTPGEVAGIYSGNITDWSQTINRATGDANPAGAVTVVRRENGSGTQVAGAHQFLSTLNCTPNGALAFVTDGGDVDGAACTVGDPDGGNNTDGVLERGTTSDLEACIRFNPGAVGPNVFKGTPPTGTHYAQINGVAPNKFAAARGEYPYWYELTFQNGPGVTGTHADARAGLVNLSRRVAFTPNTDSAVALPNVFNPKVIPVVTTGVPTLLFTKNGNSCQLPAP
jgi:hypothetical protein